MSNGRNLCGLPPSIGKRFKWRDEALTGMRASLKGGRDPVVALFPAADAPWPEGIGKTRLAVEYAHRFAQAYGAVFYVPCRTPDDLRRGLSRLASEPSLNLPERSNPCDQIREAAVLSTLRTRGDWLIVLDDAADPEMGKAIQEFVLEPTGRQGHYVVTAPHRLTGLAATPLELIAPPEEDAALFLLRATEECRLRHESDPATALEIVRELECLPLSLEIAAACISREQVNLWKYLKDWRALREELNASKDAERWMADTPLPLVVTWQMAIDFLPPDAAALATFLSCFGSEPIPTGALALAGANREFPEMERSRMDLVEYGLASFASDISGLILPHPLQQLSRRKMARMDHEHIVSVALNALNQATAQEGRAWDDWRPHIEDLLGQADEYGLTAEARDLTHRYGSHLALHGLPGQAAPFLARALEVTEQTLPARRNSPELLPSLKELAAVYFDSNQLDKAEVYLRRTIAMMESSLGRNHPDLAIALNNLAHLLEISGRPNEAETLLYRALEIDERRYGTRHPEVATDLNNLAQLLKKKGKLDEAEPLQLRALRMLVRESQRSGQEHPLLRRIQSNYAGLLARMLAVRQYPGEAPVPAAPASDHSTAPLVSEAGYPPRDLWLTAFRPRRLAPGKWQRMVVFAHARELLEIDPGAFPPEGPPGPRREGDDPRELRLMPQAPGMRFTPPDRAFLWNPKAELHRSEFLVRALPDFSGNTAYGSLPVFLGHLLLAEIRLRFDLAESPGYQPDLNDLDEGVKTHVFRRVFPCFAAEDRQIAEEVRACAAATGDPYLRQVLAARARPDRGDDWRVLIEQADAFQLFWSTAAASDPQVEDEWRYALSLGRSKFVRPTYWESPMPKCPPELAKVDFMRIDLAPEPVEPEPEVAGPPKPIVSRRGLDEAFEDLQSRVVPGAEAAEPSLKKPWFKNLRMTGAVVAGFFSVVVAVAGGLPVLAWLNGGNKAPELEEILQEVGPDRVAGVLFYKDGRYRLTVQSTPVPRGPNPRLYAVQLQDPASEIDRIVGYSGASVDAEIGGETRNIQILETPDGNVLVAAGNEVTVVAPGTREPMQKVIVDEVVLGNSQP